jgi:hypothetical protein
MTTNPRSDVLHIKHWLADLANMTAGSAPLADAKPKIDTMAAMIATELPVEAFTPLSLRAVATDSKFFPSYSDLHRLLSNWWDANRPREVFALPGPDSPALDGTAKALVIAWQRARAKDFSELRHVGDLTARMTLVLSAVTRKNDAAFAYVVAHDAEAQRIAMHKGWLRDASDNRMPTDEQRAMAHDKAQETINAIKAAKVPHGRSVTSQMSALDPYIAEAQAFEAKHGRKPGELAPDLLTEARAKAGIKPPLAQSATHATSASPAPTTNVQNAHTTQDSAESNSASDKAIDTSANTVPRWDWEKTLREASAT